MGIIKETKEIKRVRATWLAEKMDINYAKANALVHNYRRPLRSESVEMAAIMRKEARSPLYLQTTKTLGIRKSGYKK